MNNLQQVAIGAAVVAAVAVGFWLWKRGIAGVAEDVSSGAVKLASGAAAGVVKGGSSLIGIPETDADKCRKALADGNYWDASFYCPAKDFIAAGGTMFDSWYQPTVRTP